MNKAKDIFFEGGYACVLANGESVRTSDARGIRQLFEWGVAMRGADIADKIVGYAAAAIMVKFGARRVYGAVMSKPAAECFAEYGVEFEYAVLEQNIKNRDNTGVCPMEQAALGKSVDEAVLALQEKIGRK